MNLNAVENLGNQIAAPQNKNASPEALRQAAVQFEAVLLMQLTSALNGSGDADEDSLFGSDGGSDLAKKMFSEQMATTIANAGGIGLADTIMQQVGAQKTALPNAVGSLANVIAAVRDIKGNAASSAVKNTNSASHGAISNAVFTGDPNDFEVVSTAVDDIIKDAGEGGLQPFMYNGEIVNTTRPRIVPNAAVREIENSISSASADSHSDHWQMPTTGRVSSKFGMRFHPIDRRMKMHAGVDIAAPQGTPIQAAADGVVKFAGRKNGYGNVVIVAHPDGTETFYAHAQKLFVQEGQPVGGGTVIAAVGSTGKSTGPHLHFEVRQNGQPVDPAKFLSKVLPQFADK